MDIIELSSCLLLWKLLLQMPYSQVPPTSPPKKLLELAQVGIDPKGMMAGDILRWPGDHDQLNPRDPSIGFYWFPLGPRVIHVTIAPTAF